MNALERKYHGFVLIDLMITICIIGILAGISLLAYQNYIIKARWGNNIVFADTLFKMAMECQQIYGTSCTGNTGLISPSDIGMSSWPTGAYLSDIGVVFSPSGKGFHVYMDGTSDVGSYHYSRGFSLLIGSSGYIATQGGMDNIPPNVMAPLPVNPATTSYNY